MTSSQTNSGSGSTSLGRLSDQVSLSSDGIRPGSRSGQGFVSSSPPPALPPLGPTPSTPPRTPTHATHTTATNSAQPSPIILHNLPSAVASLERLRRLSSPEPAPLSPSSDFGFIRPTRLSGLLFSGQTSRPGSVAARAALERNFDRPRASSLVLDTAWRRFSSSSSQPVSPRAEGHSSVKESQDETPQTASDLPATPVSSSSLDVPVETPALEMDSSTRERRGRQRTVTSLSSSSSRSASSHSVIDLDKYIDQADLVSHRSLRTE